ncbi:TRAPP complex subunit 2-like Tca17 [Schizosaccharomyces osmophilus]|uniref:TRAPP complex subunit 2-like Tca17 n=1 Tax=Schizosaccharomyces osmophilus TaxID=2545709 RepID=A0AAF0AWB8_9SCHI|nr:TRAPP complex subunit 2-like Tca17 [Schizosaccharomyces osmophilus]WBW73427.1 TRAPP complex subunit 2-like Tca17 [Schizosaccharomyces osmophilus]
MVKLRLVFLAIAGPKNEQLYLEVFDSLEKSLLSKYQYLSELSLDVIQDLVQNPERTSNDCFLGLLGVEEDISTYAFCSNTNVKFILAVRSSDFVVRESEIRQLLRRIYTIHTHAVCNPFSLELTPDTLKQSLYFNETLQQLSLDWNNQ